jgi:peptide/nickel transport system substrate-binding protein
LRLQHTARLATVISVLAIVLAACGGGGGGQQQQQPAGQPKQGGTLVIGAEQEGDCLDLIGSCSSASWITWYAYSLTVPRVFDVVDFKYVPNVIMDGEPQLEVGPPMKVTYKIKKEAVWSDGTPITSEDIKYTWDEIMTGKDVNTRLGYDKVQTVDTPDPQTAVLTFKENYAFWKDPFYGILPSHLLKGKDRSKELGSLYTWSAGPFMIQSWNKGQDITLVPNPKYIGKKPYLDKVVFKFITDTAAELQAFKTGQVQAIQPQESIGIREQLQAIPNAKFLMTPAGLLEGLWMNAKKPPLNSKNVRQALAYAVDREQIVQQLLRPIWPEAPVLQALAVPTLPYYSDAFGKYKHDQGQVDSLMTADGWQKGGDGIWAKGGKKATLEINTTAGNKRRELVEQLIQNQLKSAGFELKVNNTQAGTLFGQWLPRGQHVIAMYAQVLSPAPGFCAIVCSDQIPGPANGNAGQNYQFYGSPAIDQPWAAAEKELDDAKLQQLIRQGNEALAEEVPLIPLYPRVQIVVYDQAKVTGPIQNNSVLGGFYNLNEWSLK